MNSSLAYEDKVHLTLERLLQKHLVSVVEESRYYCYKCFTGEIGVVRKEFIHDRINDKLF